MDPATAAGNGNTFEANFFVLFSTPDFMADLNRLADLGMDGYDRSREMRRTWITALEGNPPPNMGSISLVCGGMCDYVYVQQAGNYRPNLVYPSGTYRFRARATKSGGKTYLSRWINVVIP